eukprot:scaffold6110_cov70-Phaeocystis_antarctica.AAC.2
MKRRCCLSRGVARSDLLPTAALNIAKTKLCSLRLDRHKQKAESLGQIDDEQESIGERSARTITRIPTSNNYESIARRPRSPARCSSTPCRREALRWHQRARRSGSPLRRLGDERGAARQHCPRSTALTTPTVRAPA